MLDQFIATPACTAGAVPITANPSPPAIKAPMMANIFLRIVNKSIKKRIMHKPCDYKGERCGTM